MVTWCNAHLACDLNHGKKTAGIQIRSGGGTTNCWTVSLLCHQACMVHVAVMAETTSTALRSHCQSHSRQPAGSTRPVAPSRDNTACTFAACNAWHAHADADLNMSIQRMDMARMMVAARGPQRLCSAGRGGGGRCTSSPRPMPCMGRFCAVLVWPGACTACHVPQQGAAVGV